VGAVMKYVGGLGSSAIALGAPMAMQIPIEDRRIIKRDSGDIN
jgi:hypothetical protein